MKKKTLFDIGGLFFTILVFLLVYLPIVIIIIMSFTKTYSLSEIGSEVSLKWYKSLFSSDYDLLEIADRYQSNIDSLKEAIGSTFLITILSTIISTTLGTIFAIGINSFGKKLKTTFLVLNNMPVINPDIVTGFSLLLIFVLFQTIFGFGRSWFTVLIAHIFFSIPYVILSVLPRLNQIDPNTYEAARDLGCTRIEAVVKAIIPSIKTGIISGAMFAFTMSIDDFVITMFVSGTEFSNVSTWIDSTMRRGYIPKTVYAYNALIFITASIITIFTNVKGNLKKKGKEMI